MNTRENKLTTIQTQLNILCDAVRDLGKYQQFDIDRNTDRFFCSLLNLVSGWNLMIANPKDPAFECVQLMEASARRAVVITPSVTIKKLKHTLLSFSDYKLESRFSQLIFISATTIPVSRLVSLARAAADTSAQTSVEIWDKRKIMQLIEAMSDHQLPAIEAYLKENHLIPPPRPVHLLPSLPPESPHFLFGSRDLELAELGKMLKTRQPIFIWGLGGIGKTQTVIQLAKLHKPPKGVFMIPCIRPVDHNQEFLKESILAAFSHSSLTDYYDQPDTPTVTADLDAAYQEKLKILRTEYAGTMLIIDNLDCPGKTLAEIQAEQAYQDLVKLDLQLIFTTRSPVHTSNSIKINPLPEDLLVTLMYNILHSSLYAEEELRQLLRAVDRHTLMVVLMARTLAESHGRLTPNMLLDSFYNSTLNQDDFPIIEWDRNEDYSQRKIYAHLRFLFNVADLNTSERTVAQYATLLPENGMDYTLFLQCLPPKYQASLVRLVDYGWLQKDEQIDYQISIHPVVREVCRIELKPTDDSCRQFLQRLWNQWNASGSFQKEKIGQIAICLSIASDKLADQNGEWACWAARCWTALGRLKLALRYNQRMLELVEKNPSSSRQNLSTAYSHIGNTYQEMGDYSKALEHLKKSLEIREEDLALYDPQLASAYNNIGNIYGELKNLPEALRYHEKALEISNEFLPPQHPELARSYTNVGCCYYSMQQYDEALEYHQKAVAIFERVYPTGHPDLAQSYSYLGSAHDALNQHEKAMSCKLKALRILDLILPEEHPELARIYNSIGSTYSKLGEYAKALKYTRTAMESREKTLPPDHPDLAISYESMAEICTRQRDFRKALEYARKAMDIREKILPKDHPSLAFAYKNVSIIYMGLKDFRVARQSLLHALDILLSSQNVGQANVKKTIDSIRSVLRMLPDESESESVIS